MGPCTADLSWWPVLDTYDIAAADADEQPDFMVTIEEHRDALVAGLSGGTWGTSAGIAMVWVRHEQRRTGHGARLLEAAEVIARECGCERLNVSSFTFRHRTSTSVTATSTLLARRLFRSLATRTCMS